MLKHNLAIVSSAMRLSLRKRSYKALAAGLGGVFTFMYMILLPSLLLGKITLKALAYITPIVVVFSVLMGAALSLVLVMNVYVLRRSKATCSRKAVALSIIAGIVPNSLCCTTIVPTLIGLMAVSTTVLFTVSPAIQWFLGRYAIMFYSLALLSLLYSLQLIAKDVARPTLSEVEPTKARWTSNEIP